MAGIFLAQPLASFSSLENEFAFCAGGFMLIGLLCAVFYRKRVGLIAWALVFVALGVLLGVLQQSVLDHDRAAVAAHGEACRFELIEDAKESSYGSRAIARVCEGPFAGRKVQLFFDAEEQLLTGDQLACTALFSVPDEDYRSYYDTRAISFSARISDFERVESDSVLRGVHALRREVINAIGSGTEEQTLLRAILTGERSGLFEADFYHDIKIAGLAHLVAVSGAHLVIVSGFVALILRRFRSSVKVAVALQLVFLLAYLVLVGFPISCIRAALMSALTLCALLFKRRSSSLTAIGIATMFIVVADPSAVHQLSFQLSVAATLGIVLFMPLFDEWIRALAPFFPSFIRESLAMTLSALVFSLPISAAQFALVPLLSPLANIVATPFLSILLAGGFIALVLCAILPQALAVVLLLAKAFIAFIDAIASVPGAAIPVAFDLTIAVFISVLFAVLVWTFWPSPRTFSTKRIGIVVGVSALCIALVGICSPVSNGDRIIMLDVGQGDSFVLSSEGKNLLIDTGNEPEMLYASLARNGIASLDAVLITHPDDDHCGSLENLSDVARVDSVLVAEGLPDVEDGKVRAFLAKAKTIVGSEHIQEIGQGDTIRFGIFEIDIVAPARVDHDGGNEDSICLYARADCDKDGSSDWSAFFCGDAESDVLEELNDAHVLEKVDIYKVGHHGSRKAITPELAQILSPKVALIGVGENTYGHPTQDALDALDSVGAQVYRSDLNGDVVCEIALDSLHFTTQRQAA